MAHTKVTKTYSQNTGAANTFSYSGSFDVFKATEVEVELDNTALTYTASTINESASPREYTVDTSAKTIHIGGADLSSGTIVIEPVTDMGAPTPRADYTPGASITSADLNNNQLQLMRKAMEYDEQKLSSRGGTMTGHLTMGEDQTIIFEGATDDAYETTVTVTDPTADRTITLPNVTGTVVTTGDTATVTATMMAADSVDSSELVDGSIDTSHIANLQVTTDKLAADAVTGAKIADDAINSEHYTDGSIDTAHIAAAQVTTAKLADDAVTTAKITDGNVTTAKIAADAITAAKIADDVINSEHYAADSIDTEHYASGSVDATALASNAVTTVKINADAVTGAKIADDSIDSEHLVDGSIDTAHIADSQITSAKINDGTIVNADVSGSAAIDHSKLAAVSSGNVLVGNGSNQAASVAMSGDVAIAAGGATTIQANAVEIGMIGCEQTTISDSDSHIPTSGAVVDYVAAQIAPIGGLEVIADDESFPNTIPNAGVVISISDAAGLQVNSSGVSTNGDALDNSTITINGFPSELRGGVGSNADPYVFQSGAGLMVQSTGSSHTYNYHQALIREADFVNLSDDINDFNNRYRIASSAPGSDNDEGDLYFNTSTNKMNVYDGSAWGEVTSVGDYKLLGIKDNGQAHNGTGPTFNGSNDQYDLFDGTSDANITSAGQLLVSLNGVLQKPNASYDASGEGFALDGADGIRFCDPPPSGSSLFITQIGSATTLNVPADDSVTAAKIQTGAVSHVKLAADCVDGDNLADNACNSEHYTDGSIDHVHLAGDAVDGDNIADDSINSEHYVDGSIDTAHIADNQITLAKMAGGTDGVIITYDASGDPVHVGPGSDGQVLTSTGAGSPPAFETISTGVTSDAQLNTIAGTNAGAALDGDTTDNTLYGYDTGKAINSGDDNSAFGGKALQATTSGGANTAVGYYSLYTNTTSEHNTAVGVNSLRTNDGGDGNVAVGHGALYSNTTANENIAIGKNAMYANTEGHSNVAIGYNALDANTTGTKHTAVGKLALSAVTDKHEHTAVGYYALAGLTSGERNTALGVEAGVSQTSGSDSVFIGYKAGNTNNGHQNILIGGSCALYMDTGEYNVAIGTSALRCASGSATHPDNNVAIGNAAMHSATEANENVAVGINAMYDVTTASECVAVGRKALQDVTTGIRNTAVGYQSGNAISDGQHNTCIGYESGATITSGDHNVTIGYQAAVSRITTENNFLMIARDSSSDGTAGCWIHGDSAGACIQGNNSSSWDTTSDERLKKNIEDSTKGLAEIDQIKVRNFEYRTNDEIDMSEFPLADDPSQVSLNDDVKEGVVQTGVIAQEIEAVLPECVVETVKGTKKVNNDPIMWALVNAVKELSAKVKALEAK